MQNKNIIILFVILVLVGGGYYFYAANQSVKQEPVAQQAQEEVIESISPEDIGLEVDVRSDKKALRFTVSNTENIESIEYNITYVKDVNGEEVPEGLLGQIDVKSGDEKIGINYREFGTCSSGVCRYDKVISPVKLTLKIIKENAKIYSSEKNITL